MGQATSCVARGTGATKQDVQASVAAKRSTASRKKRKSSKAAECSGQQACNPAGTTPPPLPAPLISLIHDSQRDGPSLPANEAARITTVEAMGIPGIGSNGIPELDNVLKAMCRVFGAPYSAATFYWNGRCWLCNTVGYARGDLAWDLSACPWNLLIKQPQTIACGDLREDARFAEKAYTLAGLRTYCSAPLLASNGQRLGSCCFMDTEPRMVDAGTCRVLNNMSELVVRVVERHLHVAARLAAVRRAMPSADEGADARALLEGQAPLAVGGGRVVAAPTLGPAVQALAACAQSGYAWRDDGKPSAPPPPAPNGCSLKDRLLHADFARELRSTERTAEACVLLVDTGHPAFPIIYADETWSLWAGYERDEIIGESLFDVLMPAAASVAPVRREQLQAGAQAGTRFVVHGQVACPPSRAGQRGLRASGASMDSTRSGVRSSLPALHMSAAAAPSTQVVRDGHSEAEAPLVSLAGSAGGSTTSSVVPLPPTAGGSSSAALAAGPGSGAGARGSCAAAAMPAVPVGCGGGGGRGGEGGGSMLGSADDAHRRLEELDGGVPVASSAAAQQRLAVRQAQAQQQAQQQQPQQPHHRRRGSVEQGLSRLSRAGSGAIEGCGRGGTHHLQQQQQQQQQVQEGVQGPQRQEAQGLRLPQPQGQGQGRRGSAHLLQWEGGGPQWDNAVALKLAGAGKGAGGGTGAGGEAEGCEAAGGGLASPEASHSTLPPAASLPATPSMSGASNTVSGAHSGSEAGRGGAGAGGQPRRRVFDLSFRPAALDVLDCDALPLSVPAYVPVSTTKRMLSLYMVRLHERDGSVHPAARPFLPSTKVTQVGHANPSLLAPRFFPGIEIRQVLGVGGYGTAYAGKWHGTNIVLKVQDNQLSSAEELLDAQMEVVLGQMLHHPNLVHTLAHASVELPPASLMPFSQAKALADHRKKQKDGASAAMRAKCKEQREQQQQQHEEERQQREQQQEQQQQQQQQQQQGQQQEQEQQVVVEQADGALRNGGHDAASSPSPAGPLQPAADEEFDDDDPAYWFSNVDGMRRRPAMLTSLAHSLNQPWTQRLVSTALDSVAALSRLPTKQPRQQAQQALQEQQEQQQVAQQEQQPQVAGQEQQPQMAGQEPPQQHQAPVSAHLSNSLPLSGRVGQVEPADMHALSAEQLVVGGAARAAFGIIHHAPAGSPASATYNASGASMPIESSMAQSLPPSSSHNEVAALLAQAEASAARSAQGSLAFPVCMRTLVMMELCDGGSLQDAIDRGWLRVGACSARTPVDVAKVARIALDIAQGLEHLHGMGIVHADLSAGNVLLSRVRGPDDHGKPSPPATARPLHASSASHNSGLSNSHASSLVGQGDHVRLSRQCGPGADSSDSEAEGEVEGDGEEGERERGCAGAEGASSRRRRRRSSSSGGGGGAHAGGVGREMQAEREAAAGGGAGRGPEEGMGGLDKMGLAEGQEIVAAPPVKRYRLGPAQPRDAKGMHFVAKISDFGRARILSPAGIVRAQSYATVTHMAPEVLTDLILSPAADIYALGVLIWQMVHCSRPWPMLSHAQIFSAVSCGAAQLPWPLYTHGGSSSSSSSCRLRPQATAAPGPSAGAATSSEAGPGAAAAAAATAAASPGSLGASAVGLGVTHTAWPPELLELGQACLAHDRSARPSAPAAAAALRGILRALGH